MISRSKSNQTMRFGLLIKYMTNIFLEKSYTKFGGEASLRPFYKKSKLRISLDQQFEMLQSLFSLYVEVEVYWNILTLRCWPLDLTLYKAFLRNKRSSGTSLPTSFSTWILKNKLFSRYINRPNLITWLRLVLRYTEYVYCNCCSVCDVINLLLIYK